MTTPVEQTTEVKPIGQAGQAPRGVKDVYKRQERGSTFCQHVIQCERYHSHRWNCHTSYADEDPVLVLV